MDLDSGDGDPNAARLAVARATLTRLACPTVALCRGRPGAAATELLDRFDVVATSEAEAAPVLATAARTPIAATALAQLLRLGERLGLHDGLVAESLAYSTLQAGPEFAAWRQANPQRLRANASDVPAVLVDRRDDQLFLMLNRPEQHNAFSAAMRDALAEALHVAVSDPSIVEILLTGVGPSFSSGGDLAEFGTLPDPATAHLVRSTRNVGRLVAACADRTRVVVQGACVGAGVELPAFAHRVVARADAFFQLPELAMGLVPGAGGTVSLPRRIGRQRTAWLALSGTRIDAITAKRWGLVDEILP
ncbi:MAG: enoyl-CoA hydratase/isomerase family protein [Gaiellaceae bacterium]